MKKKNLDSLGEVKFKLVVGGISDAKNVPYPSAKGNECVGLLISQWIYIYVFLHWYMCIMCMYVWLVIKRDWILVCLLPPSSSYLFLDFWIHFMVSEEDTILSWILTSQPTDLVTKTDRHTPPTPPPYHSTQHIEINQHLLIDSKRKKK